MVNPATRAVLRDMVIGSSGLSLVTNPVGTTVFVGGYGPVEEITPSTGASRIVKSEPSTNFTVSPDGQFLYLVSDAASFITGQIERPNGGVSMPW